MSNILITVDYKGNAKAGKEHNLHFTIQCLKFIINTWITVMKFQSFSDRAVLLAAAAWEK